MRQIAGDPRSLAPEPTFFSSCRTGQGEDISSPSRVEPAAVGAGEGAEQEAAGFGAGAGAVAGEVVAAVDLVTLKGATNPEPGAAFWGCAGNVPSKPKTEIQRLETWSRIVADIFAATWPVTLP